MVGSWALNSVWLEYLFCKQEVVSSSLTESTKGYRQCCDACGGHYILNGPLAQLVEHRTENPCAQVQFLEGPQKYCVSSVG